MFTTYFHLRVKNSSGAVLKTFSPHAEVGRKVSIGVGELVQLDIEKIDFSKTPYVVGFRQTVTAEFVDEYKYIRGLTSGTGSDSLQSVLNSLSSGGWLEYNIIDSLPSGTNWVACNLTRYNIKKIKDKNVGVDVTITLESQSANVSSPFAVS